MLSSFPVEQVAQKTASSVSSVKTLQELDKSPFSFSLPHTYIAYGDLELAIAPVTNYQGKRYYAPVRVRQAGREYYAISHQKWAGESYLFDLPLFKYDGIYYRKSNNQTTGKLKFKHEYNDFTEKWIRAYTEKLEKIERIQAQEAEWARQLPLLQEEEVEKFAQLPVAEQNLARDARMDSAEWGFVLEDDVSPQLLKDAVLRRSQMEAITDRAHQEDVQAQWWAPPAEAPFGADKTLSDRIDPLQLAFQDGVRESIFKDKRPPQDEAWLRMVKQEEAQDDLAEKRALKAANARVETVKQEQGSDAAFLQQKKEDADFHILVREEKIKILDDYQKKDLHGFAAAKERSKDKEDFIDAWFAGISAANERQESVAGPAKVRRRPPPPPPPRKKLADAPAPDVAPAPVADVSAVPVGKLIDL